MPRHTLPALLALLTLLACATPPAPHPTTRVAATPVTPEPAPQPPPGDPPSPPDAAEPARRPITRAELAGEQKKYNEFMSLLNEGRAASKAGRYADAQRLLTLALAIDPTDEAVLGELGYAALQAGDLKAAATWTRRALTADLLATRRPALLYNLGLIHQKAGDIEDAANAWELSLALRPNKTVDKALKALRAAHPARTHRNTLEDVCAEARASWTCDDNPDDDPCTCDGEPVLSDEEINPDDPILNYAILHVAGPAGGLVDADHLAVETRTGGWQLVTTLANRWSPGCCYVTNNGSFNDLGLDDLLPTPGPELHLTAANRHDDDDPGVYATSSESTETTIWCLAPNGKPLCVEVITDSTDASGPLESPFFEDGPPEDTELPPELSSHYQLEVELVAPHHLAITIVEGEEELGEHAAALVGRHDISHLGQLKGVQIFPLD